jgi:hypothetical protein
MEEQAVAPDSKLKTLADEKEADQLLNQIAEHDINYRAAREHA